MCTAPGSGSSCITKCGAMTKSWSAGCCTQGCPTRARIEPASTAGGFFMRTIAVINAKRDCGKTTVATSLAAMLSFEGHLVALVDNNPLPLAGEWLSRRPSDISKIITAQLYGCLKAHHVAE